VDRKGWGLMCAVLLALTATGAARLLAAEQAVAPESMTADAALPEGATVVPSELLQGRGKLGVARVAIDTAAEGELERRLAAKGIKVGSPVLIRIFKSEAELEIWLEVNGRFELFATYPICNWSGALGPKLSEGDKQSPEGLYTIGARQLHYSVRWRRALDLGFPNTFDRAFKRTGSDVLVHGGCTSTGCYAMTDAAMEEIFWLSEAALAHGQKQVQVHAFPFRMTAENLGVHAGSEWDGFWTNLKEAYDLFERTRAAPTVSVCNNRYVLNEGAAAADASCSPNVSTVEVASRRRGRFARSRAARGSAMRAYAAARKARLAARARERQALHATGQRKVPK
jgi:murein L,D-transpeptidase YafK